MRKVVVLFKRVPLLPVTLASALPMALLWEYRPWGSSPGFINPFTINPSVGQCIVVVLVAVTTVDSLRGMITDLRHGRAGVDVLAVVAILSTLAVGQYWASWAVVLMIWSGEAIEEYAQSRAEQNLTLLVSAAPQTAHVSDLPGAGMPARAGGAHEGDEDVSGSAETAFRSVSKSESASEPSAKPPAARQDSRFHTVDVDEVRLGDVLIVLPGETVPVDGELLSGSATLDLSNINGEPVPREVYAGARVMSGAVNGSVALTMRVTQLARDSQYQRILKLVSSARSSRAAVVRTADLLAVPFTILAFCIAGLAWFISGTPLRFAQVLVLATPCPLLIAAPVAYMAGTGRLAKSGVLIKTQEVLENLGRVSHIFFDKTGTLTVKTPQVVRVDIPVDTYSSDSSERTAQHGSRHATEPLEADRALVLAGVVESYSVHILAKGIVTASQAARDRVWDHHGVKQSKPQYLRSYPVVKHISEDSGNGVSGEVDGLKVRVGRFGYVTAGDDGEGARAVGDVVGSGAAGAPTPAGRFPTGRYGELEPDQMVTYVAVGGRLAARIVLKDVPRKDAKHSMRRLRSLGVRELTMVTGDKESSARIIACEVGIDDVHAELLPEDKVRVVTGVREARDGGMGASRSHGRPLARLTGGQADRPVTMMVGDGVNDAPVLAAADIGMAITDGTTTAASESAQVVIMNDCLAAVPNAIAIARRTKRVMLQAVVAGLSLALMGMIAAAFNLIPVVVGAFGQEAIDVVSILWALTALFDREP